MGKIVSIDLDPQLVAHYERSAAEHDRSLEAELRALIERNRPRGGKDPARLRKLAEYHQALTPHGERLTDSTTFIRWDRDTNHGKWVDDAAHRGDLDGHLSLLEWV
ncbi:hypothetical protein [uncultured Sphingomonas sp.]|uniref:hypothetical protein n=1 Tax=uncultured Sphingomonas sp. TaxID=158754 RepID=UPI0035CAF2D6